MEFWSLTGLRTLNLDASQLPSLPSQIGNLTNLTWLKLTNNKLVDIPSQIGLC